MNPLEVSSLEFRRLAASVVDLSADFLSTLDTRPIFPATSGSEVERLFALDLPEDGMGMTAFAALHDVAQHSRAQNGRFFG